MSIFNNLIGARLVSINDEGFSVRLNTGEMRHFEFEEDPGDCCGYSDVTTKLFIDPEDMATAPAITKVEDSGAEEDGDSEVLTVVLFGLNRKLAEINSLSSSGSGWCYGSTMTVRCRETGEEEIMTSW